MIALAPHAKAPKRIEGLCSTMEFDIVLCSSCISACEKGKQWQRPRAVQKETGWFPIVASTNRLVLVRWKAVSAMQPKSLSVRSLKL